MIRLRKISKIVSIEDFTIECEMENGEIYKYDMSNTIKKGTREMILPLKNSDFFKEFFSNLVA